MENINPESVETPNSELGMRAFFKLTADDVSQAIVSQLNALYPELAKDCMIEVHCAGPAVAVAWQKKPEPK